MIIRFRVEEGSLQNDASKRIHSLIELAKNKTVDWLLCGNRKTSTLTWRGWEYRFVRPF